MSSLSSSCSDFEDCPFSELKHHQFDQKETCEDLRVRASFLNGRAADALLRTKPLSPLLCSGSIVFKYVGPPSSLLSFPSSCSRLFDNGGKSVLKRQLNTAQSALSGMQLGRDSWLRLMSSLHALLHPRADRTKDNERQDRLQLVQASCIFPVMSILPLWNQRCIICWKII